MPLRTCYIGGLPNTIGRKDLAERFSAYGEIRSIHLPSSKTEENRTRGFAILELDLSDPDWHRMRTTFNGANWKGKKMVVEDADEKFTDRLERERSTDLPQKKRKRALVRERKNLDDDLVTEENVDGRKGWIRGRLGRPVAVVRVRKPTGQVTTVDPAHHKESFQRFYFGENRASLQSIRWVDQTESPLQQKNALREIFAAPIPQSQPLFSKELPPKQPAKAPCDTSKEEAPIDAPWIFQSAPFFCGPPTGGSLFFRSRSVDEVQEEFLRCRHPLKEAARLAHKQAKRQVRLVGRRS